MLIEPVALESCYQLLLLRWLRGLQDRVAGGTSPVRHNRRRRRCQGAVEAAEKAATATVVCEVSPRNRAQFKRVSSLRLPVLQVIFFIFMWEDLVPSCARSTRARRSRRRHRRECCLKKKGIERHVDLFGCCTIAAHNR